MTYYRDLSPYEYTEQSHAMLNVGWLGRGHPFSTGSTPASTVERLVLLVDSAENIMRGFHYCEFCDAESPIRLVAPVPDGYVWLGTGEIWLDGEGGVRYSAPTLVVHYITEHSYLPPEEFLAAVG